MRRSCANGLGSRKSSTRSECSSSASSRLEQDLRDWQAAADKDKADALSERLEADPRPAWLIEHPTRLTADERDFIKASVEREEAQKHSRDRTRRVVIGVLSLMVVGLAILAGWAYHAQGVATENAERAQESENRANEARDLATANEKSAREIRAAGDRRAKDRDRKRVERTDGAVSDRKTGPCDRRRQSGARRMAALSSRQTPAVDPDDLCAWASPGGSAQSIAALPA